MLHLENNTAIQNNIKGVVLDSGFRNLVKLAQEVGKSKTSIPNFILKGAIHMIQSTIKSKIDLDIKDVKIRLKNI